MLVRDWMTVNVIALGVNSSVLDAAEFLREKNIRQFPVIDSAGALVGIVSDRDIRDAMPSKFIPGDAVVESGGGLYTLTAGDIMTLDPISVHSDAAMTEAAEILVKHKVGGLPVVDDAGHLVGILCQSDLVRMQKNLPIPSLFTLLDGFVPLSSSALLEAEVKRIAASKVSDAMSTKVVTIAPDMTIDEIAALMVDKKFHTLPVTDKGRLLGIVGKKDVIKTLIPRP